MSSPPTPKPPKKPAVVGRHLVRALWRLLRIYWTSADVKRGGLFLAGAVALELATVGANVLVSNGQRSVGNALGSRDATVFGEAMVALLSYMALLVVVSATRIWVRAALEIRVRRVVTGDYVSRWMGKSAYCQ